MSTKEYVNLPAEELIRLLSLSQLMLSVIEGMGEQDDKVLTTRLKDIISPKLRDPVSKMIEDFDNLLVAHLAHDLINSTEEIAEYLPEFKSSSIVELETLQ